MQVASWMQREGEESTALKERTETQEGGRSPALRAALGAGLTAWPWDEVTAACDQSKTALALLPPVGLP